MSRMYRTNGTKVVIDCPSSTLHGKSGIILEKDFVLGKKCFAVEFDDDGIYMINCDYVNHHNHEIGRSLLGSVHEVNLTKLLGC